MLIMSGSTLVSVMLMATAERQQTKITADSGYYNQKALEYLSTHTS